MTAAFPPLEIECADARDAHARGELFLDVREDAERAQGVCPDAVCIALSSGLDPIVDWARARAGTVHVLCAGGARSLRVAQVLRDAGIAATSVRGGMQQWRQQGGAFEPRPTPSTADDRYLRHLLLPEVGAEGQRRLQQSRVALVGAGGLGSPAAFYLAAAGVGSIRLIDDDVVERSNLQRQILHRDDRIGARKVDSAAATLAALNPSVRIEPIAQRLSADNAVALFEDCDVVIDGADNFPTRQLVNAVCMRHGVPWVYGAVHRFEGQVSVFDARAGRGVVPCYRCLFPESPRPEDAPNCAEAGVLGVLPGIIGTLQAAEALKLLLGIGEVLVGRLLLFDALPMRFRELRYGVDPRCPGCGPEASPEALPDTRAAYCATG
ncbi:MAG TPA: molybdopterin-synthase adenylyltransferase MoeB [Patescibacteria group bacterium]|nr:molybdopterin-synthase adenylyltransferase MoeB [Patescibacteria group bacterium]